MDNAFELFADAQSALGLRDKRSYFIGGKAELGDEGQGWFRFDKASSAAGSDDVIAVTAGGRLHRVTKASAALAHEFAASIGDDLRSGAAVPVTASAGEDSAGAPLPPGIEEYARGYTYDGSGNIQTVVATGAAGVYTKTFTWNAGRLTNTSRWVKS